jgi:hypothetical protein
MYTYIDTNTHPSLTIITKNASYSVINIENHGDGYNIKVEVIGKNPSGSTYPDNIITITKNSTNSITVNGTTYIK